MQSRFSLVQSYMYEENRSDGLNYLHVRYWTPSNFVFFNQIAFKQ